MNWLTVTLIALCPMAAISQSFTVADGAFINSTSPLRQSLVASWRFEEASGNRYDFSKYGNTLTSQNGAGQKTGLVGYAVSLTNASNQYLSTSSVSTLTMTPGGDFSVTAWVKMDGTGNSNVIMKGGAGQGDEYSLDFTTSQFRFWVCTNATYKIATTTGTWNAGTWYFLKGWYVASSNLVCVSVNNGSAFTTDTTGFTVSSATQPFYVGAYRTTPTFGGLIDELSIWKRQLTAAETAQLYRSGAGTHFAWAHP